MARYPVAWHALIVGSRDHPATNPEPDSHWIELEARVRHLVESDGGTKKLPSDARETIVKRVLPMLVSGSQGRPEQRGTSDGAYVGYVKRMARNCAKGLFKQNPHLLRALIDRPLVDQPLLGPNATSDLPLDARGVARFKRRYKRVSYRDRFLLRLVVIEEHTIAQTADQLKVSYADATTRLLRLFARLRP